MDKPLTTKEQDQIMKAINDLERGKALMKLTSLQVYYTYPSNLSDKDSRGGFHNKAPSFPSPAFRSINKHDKINKTKDNNKNGRN